VLDLAGQHLNGRVVIAGCMKSIIAKLPAVEDVLPDSLYYFGVENGIIALVVGTLLKVVCP